jgi:hypothetical protein
MPLRLKEVATMQELLVLGIIPGTNIQITFAIWLACLAGTFTMVFFAILKRRHAIRNALITYFVARQTRRTQA